MLNDRQRCWMFDRLKALVKETEGKPLDIEITGRINREVAYLLDVTAKDRDRDADIDKEVMQLTRLILLTVHSCEHLGRTL